MKHFKAYPPKLPLLSNLRDSERLLIYLAMSEVAVTAVLVQKEKGTQSPIYYVSNSMLDDETQYHRLEKLR